MPNADLSGFISVVELMQRIKDSGNEWPKVRLAFGKHPVMFSVAGQKGRFPGSVNLTDGGSYGQNKWYGRITTDGVYTPTESVRNLKPADKREFWTFLKRLRDEDTQSIFAEYGKCFGVCSFCGRELTNPQSIKDGIGPVCKEKAFG